LGGFQGGGLLICFGFELDVLFFLKLLCSFLFHNRFPLDLRGVEKPFAKEVDWVNWFLLVQNSHSLGNDQADSFRFQVFSVRLEALFAGSVLLRHLNFSVIIIFKNWVEFELQIKSSQT
jgi:hypothetical protein